MLHSCQIFKYNHWNELLSSWLLQFRLYVETKWFNSDRNLPGRHDDNYEQEFAGLRRQKKSKRNTLLFTLSICVCYNYGNVSKIWDGKTTLKFGTDEFCQKNNSFFASKIWDAFKNYYFSVSKIWDASNIYIFIFTSKIWDNLLCIFV